MGMFLIWTFTAFCTLATANDISLHTPFEKVWFGYVITAFAWGAAMSSTFN